MAGCILSIIFPLLQDDNLPVAYIVLMLLFIIISTPMTIQYVGVLNNLRSIGLILIIIFTEVFYGPLLNFRSVLPSAKSIFIEFVGPNAVPSLVFTAICWGIFIIPPWHSATYQMLQLSSDVMQGVADCLKGASSVIRSKTDTNSSNEDGDDNKSLKDTLKSMSIKK